jgi:anaerobic dimethyl sulfoxide reductase subunit B (iron-sulfur subunit)
VDYLDVGLLPACVAACPNRAIDCGDYADMIQKYGNVSRVFPLPDPAIARPGLVIKPHRNAALVQSRDPEVANWGEL